MAASQAKSLGVEFIIGGLSGIGTAIMTNPMDMVKTRLQLQGELAAPGTYQRRYKNSIQAIRTIIRHEGLMALQAGLVPATGLQIIINATRLGSYYFSRRLGWTVDQNGETIVWRTALLTGVVGSLAFIIGSPFCLAKVSLQLHCGPKNFIGYPINLSSSMIFKSLWKDGGVRKLYSAYNANTPRLFIGSAVQMTVFGLAMDQLNQFEMLSNKQILCTFIASILGGTCSVLTVHPLDLMSTRICNQGSKTDGSIKLYNSMFDVIWKTARIEGLSGLYKGFSLNWMRLAPYAVVSQGLYQIINTIHEDFNKRR